jgi:hypothetical protein
MKVTINMNHYADFFRSTPMTRQPHSNGEINESCREKLTRKADQETLLSHFTVAVT